MFTRRGLIAAAGVIGTVSVAGCSSDLERRLTNDWRIVIDETWEQFNPDRWGVGFINPERWVPDDDATVSTSHVSVEDGSCVLQIESNGTGTSGCYQGVINSSVGGEGWHPDVGIPIDPTPPTYVEATMKLPGRDGILPAFWMHPADGTWPPEIDVVELFQDGSENQRRTYQADLHWSDSGQPGDRSTHRHDPITHFTERNLTKSMNTYGCAWFDDRVEWYFNGYQMGTRYINGPTRASLLAPESRPFGLIFSNHVNRIGTADLSVPWTETMEIDRVRVIQKQDDDITQ